MKLSKLSTLAAAAAAVPVRQYNHGVAEPNQALRERVHVAVEVQVEAVRLQPRRAVDGAPDL